MAEPTESPPALASETIAQTTPPTRPVRAMGEWFWRKQTLRSARASRVLSAAERRRAEQARAAAKTADVVIYRAVEASPEEKADATAMCLAYGLYRESALWALRAHAGDTVENTFAPLFVAVPRETLLQAAGGEDSLVAVERALHEHSTSEFALLDDPAQRAELEAVRRFVHGLNVELEDRPVRVRRAWLERIIRTGVALTILIAAVVVGVRSGRKPPNLAETAHWKASSAYGDAAIKGVGFTPAPGSGTAFFSTKEEDEPWIEFDLGSSRHIVSVVVANRGDCCQERAIPLVLETSADGTTYTEVARQKATFEEWAPALKPLDARYVRLRSEKKTLLHLDRVEIH